MLQIKLPAGEAFDERTETFIQYPPVTLQLEHSLISIQKWESKWHKSYLHSVETKDLSTEEALDYIRCMSLSQSTTIDDVRRLTVEDMQRINAYINDPMTATTFTKVNKKGPKIIITAEVIYYWMISFDIPFDCAKWHLNQLFTLIEVCNRKNAPSKKSKREMADEWRVLNEARRKKLKTSG